MVSAVFSAEGRRARAVLALGIAFLAGGAEAWGVRLSPRLASTAPRPVAARSFARAPSARVARARVAASDVEEGRPLGFVGSTFGSNSALYFRQGTLVLEDGTRLRGVSFGAEQSVAGELVFTTGMVGYPETLTDPSYARQMIVMTYPIIGNYGVPKGDELDALGLSANFESDRIHAAALIVQDYSHHHSHWTSGRSLSQWLMEQRIPALYGIDTRLLTKKIREKGALRARIEFEPAYVSGGGAPAVPFVDIGEENLVAQVSTKVPRTYGAGNEHKVLAIDCGIKANIIRELVARGCEVRLVPWDHDLASDSYAYDGVFLSNGPGDPSRVGKTVETVKAVLEKGDKPVFGICMGNQLMGRAAGASTYKLPYGNRGQNQPASCTLNGACYITPQNHGYALDATALPSGWKELFVNRNDGSNEGIYHESKPFFTAQFHPEAKCGPSDTNFLFDVFTRAMVATKAGRPFSLREAFEQEAPPVLSPPVPTVRKVLLLGSGGLSIGQAGEFDYSGSQAIKALKEEGLEVVLINPNIASVQTNSLEMDVRPADVDGGTFGGADRTYLLPVTLEYVEAVIERERPDSIILSMGGQTGLNCGIELDAKGVLAKYGVQVLGTPVDVIIATEDRGIFSDKLNEIGEKIAPSFAVNTVEGALAAARQIGYPCMLRAAFALGGLGSGIMRDEPMLRAQASVALSGSPQILVEKSLKGWKEVEYEVVRDAANNCITVCNMENFDPLGVHTGDSIVVAPSQTLSDKEYHMLRTTAIKVVRHLGIVGECNIQYALDPLSAEYCIIEVNPRLSRSSALASKATGYPLAAVAAKLALGKLLPDLTNAVTKSTTACFEPSLDYIVTKIPRWDLNKFERVSREIGSAMKSVGEVMAIGRTFEESLQKALRMVEPAVPGFEAVAGFGDYADATERELEYALEVATDTRIFAVAAALERGWSVERINKLTAIDEWFLWKLRRIAEMRRLLKGTPLSELPPSTVLVAKKSGFSDRQIAALVGAGASEMDVRAFRLRHGVVPVVKQIDTTGAETPAATNYLYMTYNGDESDVSFTDKGTLVLGSGVYRIGSSVEFDWCSVAAIRTLRKLGRPSVMLNYNPETVSTDYDECDRLYFDELSLERVLDVYEAEGCSGVLVSVGGQIPNTIALPLMRAGVNVLGTSPLQIDRAEDRNKFSQACDAAGVEQPAWRSLSSTADALAFGEQVGYPLLVRPSYVLSGAAMNVAYTPAELGGYLDEAAKVSREHPVVISKFVEAGREIDVDGVGLGGKILVRAVMEHVENAGVHSGDATLMLPPQTLTAAELVKIDDVAARVCATLEITGPFNMQIIVKDGGVLVIECNVRASRSSPFASKAMGVNLVEAATRAMVGAPQLPLPPHAAGGARPGLSAVKSPMFSFRRLLGADPSLGVEMASTGEVAAFGPSVNDAFVKSLIASTVNLPGKNILVSIQQRLRENFAPTLRKLHALGYTLYASEETSRFLDDQSIPNTLLHFKESGLSPTIDDYITERKIEMVVMLSNQYSSRTVANYAIRRLSVDFGVPLVTNLQVAALFAEAMEQLQLGGSTTSAAKLDVRSMQEHYAASLAPAADAAPAPAAAK
ncbi:hypothetical protein KFE25_014431 [Diacronema lutheri]|uniref:Carbamoyl phosphate synthase arginine-specific large chain n=2 Tax=Diacronema lutheri TaxID=2081491 RepID=A0A8J5XAI8_DIALT|nr:hypothetical protein KFE25_014431 [Diacronema lutheri]